MIKMLTYVESTTTSPYENLAMEEYLLFHCLEEECILYLWQNEKTVVIGKNQNAWKECFVGRLEDDGGNLVRRLSGGGAVYHDVGNLNYTFITRSNNYDVERQTRIIANAMKNVGIQAAISGRNDILVDGKKVSGNAYYKQGAFCYHHGTLMVDVDVENLDRYLNVPEDKLKSKGIDSVRSRVGNLKDYLPEITVDEMKEQILEAFEDEYGKLAYPPSGIRMKQEQIKSLKAKYMSWDWTYGRRFIFQTEISHRFPWGGVTIQFQVQDGKIKDVELFSDAMQAECLEDVKKYLIGIPYSKKAMCAELSLYWSLEPEEEKMVKDIISWIKKEDL